MDDTRAGGEWSDADLQGFRRALLKKGAVSPGVNVIGDLTVDSGLGQAGYSLVMAMLDSDISVSYTELAYAFARRSGKLDPRLASLSRGQPHCVNLLVYNMHQFVNLESERAWALTRDRYTIAYWFWELPRIPRHMLPAFAHIDEIWSASRYVQASMRTIARGPVKVVPVPVHVEVPETVNRALFGIPEGRFMFLFSFTAVSGWNRKNPWGVIEAFERAFGRSDKGGPLLVIRAHYLDMVPQLQVPLWRAMQRIGGILLDDAYSREQMNELLACADAYVSLHRCEGFGLGMAESMYLGKPVIATYYSGNADFITPKNSYPVGCRLRPISDEDHAGEPWMKTVFESGQLWAEPDIDQAAQWMRYVWEHPEEARARGQRAAQDIRKYCSPRAVGHIVKEHLARIEESV